jgi:hypothetical protein
VVDFNEEEYINKEGVIYKIMNEENSAKMESIFDSVNKGLKVDEVYME